ncbi:MAG: CheF family chemotaxis protein [Haloarculaceae archaeon]
MSGEERTLVDTKGKFVQVVKDGRKVADLDWLSGRIILSNRRLVLVSREGKQTIVLSNVRTVKNRKDVDNAIAPVSGYFSVQVGADVYLVGPRAIDEFEEELYTALLDQEVVLVKHPAVKGGVVQDTDWQKARVSVEHDEVDLGLATGRFVEIEVDDVSGADVKEKSVRGSERRVLEVEHTTDGDTSVETHVSGTGRHVAILESLVSKGTLADAEDIDISKREHEVLMALYSGVSPFEIPDFVGMEVEEVEEIYDALIEKGLLTKSRVRREVRLKARGRNIASDVIADQ